MANNSNIYELDRIFANNNYIKKSLHHIEHGIHFAAEWNEVMPKKCLAKGHNIMMSPGFEPSIAVTRNRHPIHMTNILLD